MTVEEMISFDISECVTILNHRIDTEIVNGIYTISQKNEIDFNEEQIKELLLMFKPMQKELATYKKALELMAASYKLYRSCPVCDFKNDCRFHELPCDEYLVRNFLQLAREKEAQENEIN